LLDAGAAVRAALGAMPVATIAASTGMPLVGATVTLDGARSLGSGLSYDWAITSGATSASFTSSTTASRVGVQFNAPGIVKVRLRVTDGTGASATAQVAIGAVQPPAAAITVSPSAPVVGGSIALDGSGSTADASAGRTISHYQWAIISGNAIAALSGATDASTATVTTSAAGDFTVQLTVTDSAGAQSSSSTTVTVAAAAPASSSGGGAMSLAWLGALMLAVLALRWPAPRVSALRRARTGR
jgi:serine protease